jgi:methyl-accepting chemotaxis protein
MNWFHNLRTGAKLHLGFGLMMAFLAFTAWMASSDISKLQNSVESLYERDFALALEVAEIRTALNGERVKQLEVLALPAGQAQDRLIEDIRRGSGEMDLRMQRAKSLAVADPVFETRLAEMEKALAEYRRGRDNELALAAEGKVEEARALDAGGDAVLFAKVRDLCVAIGQEVQDRAAADVKHSGGQVEESFSTFITIAAVAFLCAALLVLLLNHVIARPLVRISGLAERIAAGDLTVEMPGSGRTDEVGVMQSTFSRMVSGLRDITRQIRDATAVLAASATEIMAATTQLASSAAETASAVAQTTTTLEVVKQTSLVSSQKARAVSDEARKAAEVAGLGRRSVEQTIEGMEGIQRQMSAIAESIVNLSTQSQAIGEIITSVDDLAAQSKLLAVNASIEAAKAGEEGKGFSVVAQEVKSLAEQSKQATAQVRGILSDIQKATTNAVAATEQGGKAVEVGVTQSTRAGESIGSLTENIAQAAQAATQIAATSQQQFVGVDQVTLAMESIKTASTQTVASTRQAEAAAQQLHELGQNLKQMVERFKV